MYDDSCRANPLFFSFLIELLKPLLKGLIEKE